MEKCKIMVTKLPGRCTECPFCQTPGNKDLDLAYSHSECSLGSSKNRCKELFVSLDDLNVDDILKLCGYQIAELYADVTIPAWLYSKNETEYAMTKLSFIRGKIGKLERSANSWKSTSIALGIVCLILLFWR